MGEAHGTGAGLHRSGVHVSEFPLSHLQACEAVAAWALRLQGHDLAVCEISGRTMGKVPPLPEGWIAERVGARPVSPPLPEPSTIEARREHTKAVREWQAELRRYNRAVGRARLEWEHQHPERGGGQLDVLALSSPRWRPPRKSSKPRISIYEIKVSESDLRSDLRAGKMLRYECQGTHVHLAAPGHLLDLAVELGLPASWGLVEVQVVGQPDHRGVVRRYVNVSSRRNARRNDDVAVTDEIRQRLTTRAAISLSHRYLRDARDRDRLVHAHRVLSTDYNAVLTALHDADDPDEAVLQYAHRPR